jgi:O-antigen/teichoic acid export membrane protein
VCFAFIASLVYVPLDFDFFLNKKLLRQLYRVGFFIYLTWATDLVFRTADRWFISQFYSKNELASYGFASSLANNVWILCLAFIAPYAQLLYKNVSEGDFKSVKSLVKNTNKKVYILVGVTSLAVAIVYPFLTSHILDKYTETYFLALVLVLVSVFLSINNMYIYYMNINNLYFTLLKSQSIVLAVNLTLNAYIAFRHLDTIYFGLSTAVSLVLYFILVKYSYERNLKLKLDQDSRECGD